MKNQRLKKFLSSRTSRTLAVLVAVVLIGAAVFANYRLFYDPAYSLGYGDNNMDDNFDDSSATGGNPSLEEDYFSATVLNRQQSRDEAIDVLKLVSESDEASAEAKADANAKLAKIALDIQNEANIETLVKAKGFEECVAVIGEDSVSVIVGADELAASDAAQILAIAYEATGVSPENISIISK